MDARVGGEEERLDADPVVFCGCYEGLRRRDQAWCKLEFSSGRGDCVCEWEETIFTFAEICGPERHAGFVTGICKPADKEIFELGLRLEHRLWIVIKFLKLRYKHIKTHTIIQGVVNV